jgi:phage baseplate assembly protein W
MPIPTQFSVYKEPDIIRDRAVGIVLPFNGNADLTDIRKGYKQPKVKDVKPFKLSYTTEEQSISNLVNLLLTRRGERLMQPDFGSPIPEFVFELNSRSNRSNLQFEIQDVIEYWLPYIKLRSVQVLSQDDFAISDTSIEHNVIIKIEFSVGNVGANRIITLFGTGDNLLFEVD